MAIITGTAGSDTLVGGNSNDTISGLDANDLLDGKRGSDSLLGGLGADTLIGGAGTFNDTLIGGDGNDLLDITGGGDDSVDGGNNDDVIAAGADFTAADRINGGAGVDQLTLAGNYAAGVTLAAATLTNVEQIFVSAGFSYTLVLNNATVASGQSLSIDGSNLGVANSLFVDGSAETNGTLVLTGGAGNDSLVGGALADTLIGGEGNDSIYVQFGGNDSASGGGGDDWIYAGAAFTAADRVDGGSGYDQLGLQGNYAGGLNFGATTVTNVERIYLYGGFNYSLTLNDATVAAGQTLLVEGSALSAANTMVVNGAAETSGSLQLLGGAGNDTLTSGGGNDSIDIQFGGIDSVTAGGGDDWIYAGAVLTAADRIDGGGGYDQLGLQGNYVAGVTLAANTLSNVEAIYLYPGFSYSLTLHNSTVASGQTLRISGETLGPADSILVNGAAETNGSLDIRGGAGNDTVTGGEGGDQFYLYFGGADIVSARGGSDLVIAGAAFTSADQIDGGAGVDTLLLQGNYSAGVALGATTLTNVERIGLLAGSNYSLTLHEATVAPGQRLAIYGDSLGPTNTLLLNGAAETDGSFDIYGGGGNDTLTGGGGNDAFYLGYGSGNDVVTGGGGADIIDAASTLTAADRVDGGAGADQLSLSGDYSAGVIFGTTTLTNVEQIQLGGGFSYALTLNDATVAAGQDLLINGSSLLAGQAVQVNGALETNGTLTLLGGAGNDSLVGGGGNDSLAGGANADRLTGGLGSDTLTGGTGNDVFVYLAAADAPASELITDFVSGQDKIDLAGLLGAADLTWGATTPTANGAWYAQFGTDTFVYANVSGTLTPDLTIKLTGLHTLASSDFIGVNAAPALSFSSATTSLDEDASTAAPIELADIVIADDAFGTNVFSLSGADAGSFEIIGSALSLKAGAVLDYETKATYSVTVDVDDAGVGTTPDSSQGFTLTIVDANEAPVITGVSPPGSGPDLVFANFGGASLWLNDGSGQFTDSGEFLGFAGGYNYDLSLGDVNGDGRIDVVVSGDNSSGAIFLNDGDGTFTQAAGSFPGAFQTDNDLVDLDRDGDLDVSFVNVSGSIEIYRNDGAGNFSAWQTIVLPDDNNIAFGDLNGDGFVDAYIGKTAGSDLVYFNDGTGILFDSGQVLPTAESYWSAIGDLDGDGDLDVLVPRYQATARVLLNDGDGNLTDSGQAIGGANPSLVALGDIDGDQDLDAYIASASIGGSLWINDGNGNFSAGAVVESPSGRPDFADLDGDGDLDLAVGLADGVRIFENDGAGNFVAVQTISGGVPFGLALGDVHSVAEDIDEAVTLASVSASDPDTLADTDTDSGNDGFNDFTYTITAGDPEGLFEIDSSGNISLAPGKTLDYETTARHSLEVTVTDGGGLSDSATVTIDVADANEAPVLTAATLDVFAANLFSYDVTVLLSNGVGGFGPATTFSSGGIRPVPVALGDVTGDGNPDIVTSNIDSNTVGVLAGDGSGGFAAVATYFSGGSFPSSVALGDVTGDGNLDIVAANLFSNSVGVLSGDGLGGFAPAVTLGSGGSGPYSVAVGDVTGDGNLDIVVTNRLSNTVGLLAGDGAGGFAAATSFSTGGSFPFSIAVGDVTGDDNADIVVANRFSNTVGVLAGDGNGGFASVVTYASGGADPTWVALGDVTGDGSSDIVVANVFGETIGVLTGDGAGSFAAAVTYTTAGSLPSSVAIGDVTGDGIPDIVAGNEGSDTIAVLAGDGAGGFSPAVTYATGASSPVSVAVGDLQTVPENVSETVVLASVTALDPDTLADTDATPTNDTFNDLSYTITAGDPDGLFEIDAQGAVSLAPGKSLDYQASRQHTLEITVTDGVGLSDTATLTINVSDVSPVALPSLIETNKDTPIQGWLSAGADAGDSQIFSVVDEPTHGELLLNADGTYLYTPDAGYVGADTFSFSVSDNEGATSEATATINVAGTGGALEDDQVSTVSYNDLSEVTALADGGHLVVWHSLDTDGSGYGIFAQRYGADGAKAGSEFQVNVTTDDHQFIPSTAGLPDGGFVVTWTSSAPSLLYGVAARVYAADGSPLTNEFLVSQQPALVFAGESQVGALAGGRFVISWTSGGDMYGRLYEADGTPVTNQFLVNQTTAGEQEPTSQVDNVTGLAAGGFVVTWGSNGQDGSGYGVYARLFDVDGAAVGNEFRANTTIANNQSFASVGALGDGGFVVAWSSLGQDGSQYGVYAQRYDAIGNAVGGEFQVNTVTLSQQLYARVQGMPDGGFIVVWESGDQDDISAQRYAADGSPVGGEFNIPNLDEPYDGTPSVALREDGALLVTWTNFDAGHIEQKIITDFDGGAGAKNLLGGLGSDSFLGSEDGDSLNGGSGADRLDGLGGNDLLVGGAGNDLLIGGGAADTFKWNAGDQGSSVAPAVDTIADFDATLSTDVLDVADLLEGETANASSLDGFLDFGESGGATVIDIRSSGISGPVDQQIVLLGVNLTAIGNDQAIINNLLGASKLLVDS